MRPFQWNVSGSWVDAPEDIQIGARSKIRMVWPKAKDRDGLNRPCGAVGKPSIQIEYATLSAAGLALWMGRFTSGAATYATIQVTAPNDRDETAAGAITTTWPSWSGLLERPEHGGLIGNTGLYEKVKIVISECAPL